MNFKLTNRGSIWNTNLHQTASCLCVQRQNLTLDFTLVSLQEKVQTTETQVYYYHSDHLGSTGYLSTHLQNGHARITQHYQYTPFGEAFVHQKYWQNTAQFNHQNPYEFNGKEKDLETGYNYYGARHYNAAWGVWLGVDPLASQAPGWTPYRFGFNNPIRYIDPNGLFETESDAKQWAKDNKIPTGWFSRHKVEQESDGSWAVNNRKEGASYFRDNSLDGLDVVGRRDDGVIKSPLVLAQPYNEISATASEIWNSPIARRYVPDKISLSFSSSVTAFAGTNTDFSLNWITRGHDAQFTPYAVLTVGGQGGPQVSADALINFSAGYYATSDMRSLQRGQARDGLLGWSAYGSADAGLGLGGSVTGSVGFQDSPFVSRPTWISGGVGIGASIGGGATGGVSYSWPIVPSQFKR